MTSRERVLRAFHHEETDRVPVNMRFAPDLARKVGEFVGKDDLEAYFDYDIRSAEYVSEVRLGGSIYGYREFQSQRRWPNR
jgi:hypothetical protein